MNPIQSIKPFNAIPPGVIKDDAAFTSYVIDTAVAGGAKTLAFAILLGTIDADIATLKVMQSDTKTNDTTLGGTPDEVVDVLDTITPGDANDNAVGVLQVNLQGPHKRYMQLQATAGDGAAGTYLAAFAMLLNVGVPESDLGALFNIEA